MNGCSLDTREEAYIGGLHSVNAEGVPSLILNFQDNREKWEYTVYMDGQKPRGVEVMN